MVRARNPQQKLLYVSGYGDALPSIELSTANAPVLRKPVYPSELLDAVQEVMAGEEAARELTRGES
jgi:hypothetical protein